MSGWFNKGTLVRVKMLRGVENSQGDLIWVFCCMFKETFVVKNLNDLNSKVQVNFGCVYCHFSFKLTIIHSMFKYCSN